MKIQKYIRQFLICVSLGVTATAFAQEEEHIIVTTTGKYAFTYNQTPDNIVALNSVTSGFNYYWEQSTTPDEGGFTTVSATPAFAFSGPLTQTMWYRRKALGPGGTIFSNIIKIALVSVNRENINYIREHDILITGQTDWKIIDVLPIGQKLQTTTYMDGLGRPLEKISRETATPSNPNNLWGDVVQFSKYDGLGREPMQYLPYTTTYESGKFKTATLTEQQQYYFNTLSEHAAFSLLTFDNSPLNRVMNAKSPGFSWAAGAGNTQVYDLNEAADNVQNFTIGYNDGDIPVTLGAYDPALLSKSTQIDENGDQVIEYVNMSGQVILTKTQIDDNPSNAHSGWICVYSIYDDFGLLRYRLQPEAVKYLDTHNWSFSGTDGQQVLNELCFRYEYDEKGRNILKKAPGAKELRMLYDKRDRVVFMQDGNQSVKTPMSEWTANIYDELDRPMITTLYKTSKTPGQLQTDIYNAVTLNTVNVVNPNQPVDNLVIDNRQTNIPRYAAQNTIEFTDGFLSADNDEFIAEIDITAYESHTVTATVYGNPIPASDLNNSTVCTILKYLFYDDHSFSSVKPFDNNFNNTTAYSSSDPNVIPIATSKRTISFPTGSMVRVLGTNTFLSSTEYYDEKGRHIQTIEDNFKSGKDVTTMQYHWDGRLLSTHSKHTSANSGYSNFSTLTKNIFDKIGRVTSLQKKYGSNEFKTIANYELDDMGRLKTKILAPSSTPGGGGLETLTYSYNIHNNITGINKDYALKESGYDKWAHYFGLYLGYDNRDNVFNNPLLDGRVTGLLWNTQGDDAQRKYDYTYDNAGRLIKSDFKEKQTTGAAWDNTKMDFTVGGSGNNNSIEYDLNGNLQTMFQKGVVTGNNTPLTVDNMQYTYASYSNKLLKVTDNGNAGTTNGKLGDFADGSNGNADDYVYDDNGNLVVDLNKNAKDLGGVAGNGIRYNFLDKPEEIRISGKGLIQIVYDADGNKLQKKYTPENTTNTVTTTYINEFVYQGNDLSYINFEEGRIRVMTPIAQSNQYDALAIDGNMILPGNKKGAYDFFIRDYQQNVRMILTEEIHGGSNTCSMEGMRSGDEEPMFGQIGGNNEVAQTRCDKPVGWQSNISGSVSKLSALTHKAGPNVLLKVMAGDEVSAATQYYFQNAVINSAGNSLTPEIVSTLIQSILGSNSTGLAKANTTNISNQLLLDPNFINATNPEANNPDGTKPKAYLSVIFFDERFNFVSEGSTALRVYQQGDGAAPLVLPNIKSPKSGYAYVYLSNESNEPVYFDNFIVGDNRGRIIEEDHYYSFGLKIAAISSKKLADANEGNIGNKNLYNDKELFEDADLDWYNYGFRSYDPQIGRFPQLDPLTDEYPELTPYQYGSNDPILNIDIDGLEGCPSVRGFVGYGGMATSSAGTLSEAGTKIVAKAAERIVTNAIRQKIGNQIINYALQQGGKRIGPALGGVGLFVFLVLSPDFDTWGKVQNDFPESYYENQRKSLLQPLPQPLPSPKFNPPPNKPIKDDDAASVRFQVQTGNDNVASKRKTNTIATGVTKSQGYSALGEIYTEAIKKDITLLHNNGFAGAVRKMSKRIKTIQGGLSKGVFQTTLQEKFIHKGKTYRIDVEVQRGVNFKQ